MITPYSAAAGGSLDNRSSSRRASFSASSGILAASILARSSSASASVSRTLAQLLLDRLHLLAQEVLTLRLAHFLLNIGLDLAAQFQDIEFLG